VSRACENEHLGIHVHVVAPGSVQTDVSKNALVADGSTRGVSDAAIDNGMPAAEAAAANLGAIAEGKPEVILAVGLEHDLVMLRRREPETLFAQMSGLVRAGYAQRMAEDTGTSRATPRRARGLRELHRGGKNGRVVP
jgi:short-subunit dehydrogenase